MKYKAEQIPRAYPACAVPNQEKLDKPGQLRYSVCEHF